MEFHKFGAMSFPLCKMHVIKLWALFLFLISSALSCDISFNNKSGIPFSIQYETPYVSSFEVDKKGDFYFSGADSLVRKISGVDQRILFTRSVKGLRSGQLGLIGETLWVVSRGIKGTVRLVGLDPNTGEIKSDTSLSFDKSLGSANMGYVVDQKIIFSFAYRPPTLNYVKIDPVLKTYQVIKNRNDIDLGPDSLSYKLPAYLGKWDSMMVFSAPRVKPPNSASLPDTENIALVNEKGIVVGSKDIPFEDTEELFPSTAVSLIRMTAGKVYFLRKKRKEKKAKINSIDLTSIPISTPSSTAPSTP